MQGIHLRKYGVEATVDFEVYEVDGVDLRVDWVPAQADCEIMKDGGASTQCDNTATDEGSTYSIVLTATEMQFARGVLKIVDAATKVFLDKVIIIETYGHPSAQHAFDLDTVSIAQSADNDTKLTTIAGDVVNIDGDAMRGTNGANTTVPDAAGVAPTAAEIRQEIDSNSTRLDADVSSRAPASEYDTEMARITANVATEAKQDIIAGYLDTEISTILSRIGTPADIDGGGADLANNLKKIADDNAGADFDATSHSLKAIGTRGDAGAITQMIYPFPLIPSTIDLADTAVVRIGIGVVNMLDDLPSTAEITPGTISIDRKAAGGASWSSVVNAAACSEAAGIIYYDEVFDDDTGYRPGDAIRITFKGQKVTVDANDHELVPADGWIFHTYIRGAERTDTANATHTYTVLDGDGNGIADVLVEAKINDILIQSARTNTSGIATFYLAPGTFDFYATKAGYSFNNPDTETVS